MLRSRSITVLGAGLLGTSLGLALKAAGSPVRLCAWGRRQETLDAARARGAFDEVTTDLAAALAGCDLVVIAVPLSAFDEAFQAIARHAPRAVVTDVGSAKGCVAEAARRLHPAPARVIGAHPMAGSEQSGPLAARADLFAGKPCVLTLCPHDEAGAVAEVRALWGGLLGMRLVEMSPEDHDLAVAAVSHLPHLAALALAKVGQDSPGLAVASTGYRDATRLAAGDAGIWADIFAANPQALLDGLAALRRELDAYEALVRAGDRAGLRAKIEPVAEARRRWKPPQP